MEKKYFKCIVLASSMLCISACSDDNPLNPLGSCGSGSWATEVTNESAALSAAQQAYDNDPTVANCNAYKAAGVGYLDALEDAQGCVVALTRVAFDEAVDEAQAEMDAIDCTEGGS